ncbi:hypothetical protein OROMI_004540 [Orobanche minor]
MILQSLRRRTKSNELEREVKHILQPTGIHCQSTKLDMLKDVRAQGAATMNKRSIAAATVKRNSLARASLIESRLLIAEANQIIDSIGNGETIPLGNGDDLSNNSIEPVPHLEREINPEAGNPEKMELAATSITGNNLPIPKRRSCSKTVFHLVFQHIHHAPRIK